jgi:peptidoglycan/xylan/chitin deacetylase (PgdA/CDA1 family)
MTLPEKIYSRLRRKFKYLQRDLYHQLGGYSNFYADARGSRIMVYHGICPADPLKFKTLFISERTFEAHLKFYKRHFNVISLDDYYREKFSDSKFNICLTFDDGFANNYKYVLPLLAEYEMPATFFITAIQAAGYDILWNDFLGIVSKYGPDRIEFKGGIYLKDSNNKYRSTIDNTSLADKLRATGFKEKAEMMKEFEPLSSFKNNKPNEDYWLQMTAEQIREVAQSPWVTIGAHGHYHNDLTQISNADALNELILTKQYLEHITGKKIKSIAFPYGAYNPGLIAAAIKCGYEQLLAVDFNNETDNRERTMRERFTVNPFISVNNQMYATITRKYE